MTTSARLIITNEVWVILAPVVQEIKHKAGRPPQQSDRMFLEAVLYLIRTGIPWRDLPQECGKWDAVYKRFRRWEARGLWKTLWERFPVENMKLAQDLCIDSTSIRAHHHAAGALKKTGGKPPRLWAVLAGACQQQSMQDVYRRRSGSLSHSLGEHAMTCSAFPSYVMHARQSRLLNM